MYKITFKGKDVEHMMVEDVNGKKIWDLWVNSTSNQKIVCNDTAFLTGDIKNIAKVELTPAELAPKRDDSEYLEFRKKMLSLPIEKRAQILRFAKMIWSAHTRKEMPEDVKEEIKKAQLEYFKENPNCIYANPKVYRHLIAEHNAVYSTNTMQSITNSLPKVCLGIIEAAVQTDLQYSVR